MLVKIADALLAREVLDAEQVKRLAAGLAARRDAAGRCARRPSRNDEDESRPRQKERTPMVPSLNKPLPQE